MRTVLIVDDHAVFRRFARLLAMDAGLQVVGEADSVSSAISQVTSLAPDIILLDLLLPDGSGADVAAAAGRQARPPTVLIVSSRAADDVDPDLLSAVDGRFITKSDLSVDALRRLVG